MFTNVKLPGDENWTKITPEMAKEGLAASMREENLLTQRRLAAKLIPGPRERLSRLMSDVQITASPLASRTQNPTSQVFCGWPFGKRP